MHYGQEAFHKDNHRIQFLLAGNRCVVSDTKIATADGEIAVADISSDFLVWSFDQQCHQYRLSAASRPFPKAKENLYRVIHTHGEFVVSAQHQILCADGKYRSVEQLRDQLLSSCVYLQGSNRESSQQEFLLNEQHCSRKLSNLMDHCAACTHRYGQQLLHAIGLSQFDIQALACALPVFSASYHKQYEHLDVAQAPLTKYNRHDRHVGHHEILDLQAHVSGQFFFSPCSSQLLKIESLGKSDWVWDFQVPGDNNYLAEGVVHHNSGKSTGGATEFIWCNTGTHPYKKNKVPIKSAIVGPDFENHSKGVLEPKFDEWMPSNAMRKIERHQNGAMKRLFWTSGSKTDLFSWDQDMMVFEGSDYDLIWFDEPPPHMIWKALWRSCVDRGGRMYMTGTPLMSPWLYQVFQQIKDNNDPLRWYIRFSSKVNAKNIGQGDEALGLKRLDELAAEYNDEERAARLDGDFVQVQGLIFKSWDRHIHTINSFEIPVQWEIIESIDPHPHKPWAVTWTAIAPNGAKILIQAMYVEGVIDEIANQIIYARGQIEIKDNLRLRISRTLIDNSSSVPLWQKSNTDPTARRISVREELENMIGPRGAGGPRVEVCPKNVQQKIDILKQWLHVKPRNNVKRADFYVFNNGRCEDFIHEIENYVWDRFKNRNDQGLKDKPVKKNDDLLDSVMQVALVLGSKTRETDDVISLIDGLSTYGGSNTNGSRTLKTRQDSINWENR